MRRARSPGEPFNRTEWRPLWGICMDCAHGFVVAWLPMPIDHAAQLMKRACCPSCASARIAVPEKQEIVDLAARTLIEKLEASLKPVGQVTAGAPTP